MSKAERQTPFSRECDVFLTSAIGNAGAGASAHGATNQSSFATTRKRANERTAPAPPPIIVRLRLL